MKSICCLILVALLLTGCSPPVLNRQIISSIHSVRVVYMQAEYDLGMYAQPPTNEGGNLVTMGEGGTSLTPMLVLTGIDLTPRYLNSYRSQLAELNVRERVFDDTLRTLHQIPWLSHAKVELVDRPMVFEERLRYTRQSGVDAVIFMAPYFGLNSSGREVTLRLNAELFLNPHPGTPYSYRHESFGIDRTVEILHQDPKKPHRSIYALGPAQAVHMWFSDDAIQLRNAVDAALQKINSGLVLYYEGDSTSAPQSAVVH